MALSPREMDEAIIRNLKAKSGKELKEWIAILEQHSIRDKKAVMNYLKTEGGLGHIQAQVVFSYYFNNEKLVYDNPEALTQQLIKNENPAVQILFKDLTSEILALGEGVNIKPCKTYIPFYRKIQFAAVKPFKGKILIGWYDPEETNIVFLSNGINHGLNPRFNCKYEINSMNDWEKISHSLKRAYNLG